MKLSLVILPVLLTSAEGRWRPFQWLRNGNGGGGGNGQGSGGNGNGSGQGNGGGQAQGSGQGNGNGSGQGNGGQGQGGGQGNGGNGSGQGRGNGGGGVPTATTPLDEDEKSDILFMREEEKLARDVYLTFSEMYDLPIFANIAESEQWHMDRMETLIDTYNLEDPVEDESDIGTFKNSELQDMYNNLTLEGSELYKALYVGARIEEIDIQDLEIAIEDSDQADSDFIYSRLLRASHNHLRAFVREYELLDKEYVAQVLEPAEVNAILNR